MQNPRNMGDDELKAQIRAVIERMMFAGWIRESAHSRGIIASELTADGKIATRLLQKFLRDISLEAFPLTRCCCLILFSKRQFALTC